MGITGDRYVGEFDGHKIELVRDNWAKTLELYVDGVQVAAESRVLPHDITLTATFQGKSGATHQVTAKSIVNGPHIGRFAIGVTANDSIEIDGRAIAVQKTK
jgi:hypothetical protein